MSKRVYGSSVAQSTWFSSTHYSLGDTIAPNDRSYRCILGGISGIEAPSWDKTIGNTITDGTVIWICQNLIINPLTIELDSEGYGNSSLKDIWVKNTGEAEFIVYGNHDGSDGSWRQIDEITVPHGNRDNRHKSLQNTYRHIRVTVESNLESEIEIVGGV